MSKRKKSSTALAILNLLAPIIGLMIGLGVVFEAGSVIETGKLSGIIFFPISLLVFVLLPLAYLTRDEE